MGDYVRAGEVLADLDASSAWNTYNRAMLNLESAQISMDELLAPPTDSELAVAEANVASAQASYSCAANSTTDDQIAQLQLKYQQAQDQLAELQTARASMSGTEEEISLQEAKIGTQSFNVEIARRIVFPTATPTPNATEITSVEPETSIASDATSTCMLTINYNLNLRSQLTTENSSVSLSIPYGTAVTTDGVTEDGWYRVTYDGQTGWNSGDYVTPGTSCAALSVID